MQEIDTLVIGGGISGLATAWQLADWGNEVEVWEAQSRLGGKIATDQQDGWTTEQSASMVLNFLPQVNQFLEDSGLSEHKCVRTETAKRYIVNQGELQEIPMKSAKLLFSPLWTLRGKLRLLAEPLIFSSPKDNETVADFIRRRLGSEMLDKALGAYISGTLASDPELADSRAVLPHLTALEQQYGSLTAGAFSRKVLNKKTATNTEGFSFRGGMSTLIEQLSWQLGARVSTQHHITDIEPHAKGWVVNAATPAGEKSCLAKRLVLSTPAATAAKWFNTINPKLQQLLLGIHYAPVSVVHLGFQRNKIKHEVEGTGFLTPFKEDSILNGSMWMHSLFEDRAPQDHVLLSNYLGGARHPQISNWDQQQLIDTSTSALDHLLSIKGEAVWAKVDQHQQALPQYHGKYMLRQQAIASELQTMPGLHLQANYLGGVSIRDRISCAHKLAFQLNRTDLAARQSFHLAKQPSLATSH